MLIHATYLLEPLHEFFAARIFGPDRRELLTAALPEVDATEGRQYTERDKALNDALTDLRKRRERQFPRS